MRLINKPGIHTHVPCLHILVALCASIAPPRVITLGNQGKFGIYNYKPNNRYEERTWKRGAEDVV